MTGPDWLDGAVRIDGTGCGPMLGGPPRWVWHTYEAGYSLTALAGARALHAAGNDVHFTFHPVSGDVVQLVAASQGGRGLENHAGGVETNRCGDVCIQVEVIARASRPWTQDLTDAGRAGLARLMDFARAHGIPDVWPAGLPPAYPPGDGNRDPAIWTAKAGHYGHSQVPENSHGDPGALDVRAMFAASAPTTSTGGHDMAIYRDNSGGLYVVDSMGKRALKLTDEAVAFEGGGGKVARISDAGLAAIPDAPTQGSIVAAVLAALPAWVRAPQPPATVGGAGSPSTDQFAAATVNLLAARLTD